jgi:phosphomannomutase
VDAPQDRIRNLTDNPPDCIAGFGVRSVETVDGIKLRFQNGWILFRASGTERVLRIYCEMETERDVRVVLAGGTHLLQAA